MKFWMAGLAASLAVSAPAAAEVVAVSDTGFVVRVSTEVNASAEDTWKELVTPADWWDKAHTWSGDAANLYIDPQATGCFCERLPGIDGGHPGSVEHMRLINVAPGRVLRMVGALGPLQSEAVTGTMTITLKPVNGKTRILWEYVVGGYMRYKPTEIAPAVDAMLAGQLTNLAAKLGPSVPKPITPKRRGKGKPGTAAKPADKLDVPKRDERKPDEYVEPTR